MRVLLRQLGHTHKGKGENHSTKECTQEQGSGALLWQLALSFLGAKSHVRLTESLCRQGYNAIETGWERISSGWD